MWHEVRASKRGRFIDRADSSARDLTDGGSLGLIIFWCKNGRASGDGGCRLAKYFLQFFHPLAERIREILVEHALDLLVT